MPTRRETKLGSNNHLLAQTTCSNRLNPQNEVKESLKLHLINKTYPGVIWATMLPYAPTMRKESWEFLWMFCTNYLFGL